MTDEDFAEEETQAVEVKSDSHDLMAVLRSERYDDDEKRRFALETAARINIAGYGSSVLDDAKAYYAFLKGA